MKNILLILFLTSFGLKAQIYMYDHVFSDSTAYNNFNQGVLDAGDYFKGTGDYFIGAVSVPFYFVPAAICYTVKPKDRRFVNRKNPNNEYLFYNADYYQGYRYGATKKKRKRLIQGAATPIAVAVGLIITALSVMSN